MGLKKAIKKKEPPKNQVDFIEKVEKEKTKREEKEKLKLLEKLESQVLKIKKTSKLNIINSTISSEATSHKRLIDNIPKNDKIIIKQTPNDDKNVIVKFDKKLLDDSEFRKLNIIKKKIEINCDYKLNVNELEKDPNNIEENKEKNNNKTSNYKIFRTDLLEDKDNKNDLLEEEDEIIENEFIKGLSKEKLKFFMFKAHQIYNFLTSIKLVRYIEIFIEDGFEDLESILGKNLLYHFIKSNFHNFI